MIAARKHAAAYATYLKRSCAIGSVRILDELAQVTGNILG